jgi:hypothetical protein
VTGSDRRERVVVDLTARDHRHELVEQRGQRADDTALCLPALAEKDHVVAGEDGVLDLGDDGVFVPDDAGKDALAGAEAGDQILPHLLTNRENSVTRGLELTQRAPRVRTFHRRPPRRR